MRIPLSIFFVTALLGCDGPPTPGPAPATQATAVRSDVVPPDAPASGAEARGVRFDPLAGLTCKDTPAGWPRDCSAPGYDVSGSLDACRGDSAFFGVVLGDAAVVATDRLAGGRHVATLASGQLVCIQLTADPTQGSAEPRAFVTAVAPDTIEACEKAHCGDARAESRWIDRAFAADCRVEGQRYSAGCVSGWVRSADIDAYSMGLRGQLAEGASKTQSPSDVIAYGKASLGDGECVAGAQMDDLGRQKAVVSRVRRDGTRQWSVAIPHEPDFHQSRATHCACTGDACYVAVATDTQPAQSLSQTLLSVARLDPRTGNVVATRAVNRLPNAGTLHSASIAQGASNFAIRGAAIEIQGQWQPRADAQRRPFRLSLPLF